MKVAKFGGSSVASAEQLKKVARIIESDESRRVVVVSAPGKRDDADTKVTDLLIELGQAFQNGEDTTDELNAVLSRFKQIITELDLTDRVLKDIKEDVHKLFTEGGDIDFKLEALKAIGEDSLAKVLSEYLVKVGMDATYLNPKDAGIMLSDEPGSAQILDESFDHIYNIRKRDQIVVIPGFFGYTKEGKLVTFSRGGSDITGSIVAAGVEAELYENFTDVDSVYCVNPQIVHNPKEITSLTYKEMRELSYAGFSVFHAEALIPAFKAEIPVSIKNTNNPNALGTIIVSRKEVRGDPVVGIASDKGFMSLYVSKYLMNREVGFGRRLLNILEDEGISYEHTPSGIDDLSVIIRENQMDEEKEQVVINRINQELNPDTVYTERGLALIMVVGEEMHCHVGTAAKAAQAIGDAGVNIEMINQGSSEVSLMFGIKEAGVKKAVQSLYNAFFE
ncbi:aspartate kinase [Pelagirhabdus alkalitolerans]|uniref:Aspartokinase n=1 Tax=Pelagirhabdus alkalitolerans TaxID=1612202 RepID=A0A1G6HCK7_9BACI|nr:aspartate kinase [Pelagirhabdus alkalitolerans]SDB92012.1 aspartate kinase [Pelagirhabdus alkalitolerans]